MIDLRKHTGGVSTPGGGKPGGGWQVSDLYCYLYCLNCGAEGPTPQQFIRCLFCDEEDHLLVTGCFTHQEERPYQAECFVPFRKPSYPKPIAE